MSANEPAPETELSPKLVKRMEAIKAAGGTVPWTEAPKQHRQLRELGLIYEGDDGAQKYAVLVTEQTRALMDTEEVPA